MTAGGEQESADEYGWYVYGIARSSEAGTHFALGLDGEHPVRLVEWGPLAAFVSPVRRAEFSPEAVQTASQDPKWLEERARAHARLVGALHEHRTVIPFRFGTVFRHQDGVLQALREHCAHFLAQLARFAGGDEWGLKVYFAPAALEERVRQASPSIRRLQDQAAQCSPGAAYLLHRLLATEVLKQVAREQQKLAAECYDRLCSHSQEVIQGPLPDRRGDGADKRLLLRAVFLVRRPTADRWLDEVQAVRQEHPELTCLPSGPWPPYSFAASPKGSSLG